MEKSFLQCLLVCSHLRTLQRSWSTSNTESAHTPRSSIKRCNKTVNRVSAGIVSTSGLDLDVICEAHFLVRRFSKIDLKPFSMKHSFCFKTHTKTRNETISCLDEFPLQLDHFLFQWLVFEGCYKFKPQDGWENIRDSGECSAVIIRRKKRTHFDAHLTSGLLCW